MVLPANDKPGFFPALILTTFSFSNIIKKVDANINNKEYVRTMRSDFGTSTPENQIATNIAIMSSTQVNKTNYLFFLSVI